MSASTMRGRPFNYGVKRDNVYSDASSSGNGQELDSAAMASLDKRMSAMKEDFTQALTKISSKENEKFNLIFSILSELQQRQAQLEDSVRTLKNQQCQQPAGSPGGQAQQVPVTNSPTESFGSNNEAMQSFAIMQDGTQAVLAPVVFVQQMPQPMVMQFVGQAPAVEEQHHWGNAEGQKVKSEEILPVPVPVAAVADAN
mmetsp:Transcript_25716/g.59992  ORF Transcript_25716/g.59992 Transcript_25716/m.59992 type:complete len:199 (+) Transcript_25716:105-701(+)|eukprot:CAMPEP_0178411132 /NCGR_PEP_ID=MMETSP0689_2-20121128/21338_1 /TAXON_ID=160604 /ORGANISM="Amphidinium massartii, Strain CS-259" /LENGTH=198 /DNA_ID=CAMNT_0020032331 /DNA_START=87 /DNA_END=683 /DNA_ORIENTATION=+